MNLKRINWILIGAMVVINIVFYPFLPSRMVVQISFSGTPSRFIAKEFGFLILPAIAVLLNFRYSGNEASKGRTIIINTLLFIVNLGINIFNVV